MSLRGPWLWHSCKSGHFWHQRLQWYHWEFFQWHRKDTNEDKTRPGKTFAYLGTISRHIFNLALSSGEMSDCGMSFGLEVRAPCLLGGSDKTSFGRRRGKILSHQPIDDDWNAKNKFWRETKMGKMWQRFFSPCRGKTQWRHRTKIRGALKMWKINFYNSHWPKRHCFYGIAINNTFNCLRLSTD